VVAADSYDLVIVGAGSGNTLPADQFAGWRIAVVEADGKLYSTTKEVKVTVGGCGG